MSQAARSALPEIGDTSSSRNGSRDAGTHMEEKRFASKKTQILLKPPAFRPRELAGVGVSILDGVPASEQRENQKESEISEEQMAFAARYIKTIGKGCADRAVWKAAHTGDAKLIRALVNGFGGKVHWCNPDYYNYTALHAASQKGHFKCIKLLADYGADVHAQGDGGETPLHEACHEKHQLCALFLMSQGAVLTAETKYKKTALDFSAANNFAEALQDSFVAHQLQEETIAQFRTALAASVFDRSTEGVARARDRSKLQEALAAQNELEKIREDNRAEISRLSEELDHVRKQAKERNDFLEEQVRIEDSKRRAAQRETGDLQFELRGVREQLEICKKSLLESYSENDQLDKYIENSVAAVSLKNRRKHAIRVKLESPRTVKLETLQKRVQHAEESAFHVNEQREAVERESVVVKRRLLRVEKELYEIRAGQRRQKYSAIKIQRVYRKYLEDKRRAARIRHTFSVEFIRSTIAQAIARVRLLQDPLDEH